MPLTCRPETNFHVYDFEAAMCHCGECVNRLRVRPTSWWRWKLERIIDRVRYGRD